VDREDTASYEYDGVIGARECLFEGGEGEEEEINGERGNGLYLTGTYVGQRYKIEAKSNKAGRAVISQTRCLGKMV